MSKQGNIQALINDCMELIKKYRGNDSGLRAGLHQLVASKISSMDLVGREEFDIQKTILSNTRKSLEELENKIISLEENKDK